MDKPNNNHMAHDKFIRTVMADTRVAKDFFNVHLPEELRKVTDFKNLKLQPRSHIDDVRKETTVDILYKTTIAGEDGYLYLLLEHQSKPDKLMPFRILKYVCNIMNQHIETTKKKSLPLVYPIVIYHAEQPYPYSTDLRELVNAPKNLVEHYFLKPFQLIDLGKIGDEELKKHAWTGAMEFALKHIFARDIMPYLTDFADILHRIAESGGRDYISIVLQYILEKGELKNQSDFFELINTQISPEVGDKIMSLAEQLREEGAAKRNMEIAEKLLSEEVELAFIAKITGMSLKKLQELKKKH